MRPTVIAVFPIGNSLKTNSATQPWLEKVSKRDLFLFIGQKQTSSDKIVDNELNKHFYI
jgi:hypothetical protein